MLDSRAAVLKCNTNYCMCLTTTGSVYVWKYKCNQQAKYAKENAESASESDLNSLTTLINRQSCQSILKDGTLTNVLLTDQGIPVIYVSKNRSYFFSLQTQCWHLVPAFGTSQGSSSAIEIYFII